MPVNIVMGETARVKSQRCPVCRGELDAATVLTSEKGMPEDGDFTVCIYCATVLRFGIGLMLRRATDDDLREILHEAPEMFAVLNRAKAVALIRIKEALRRNYKRN